MWGPSGYGSRGLRRDRATADEWSTISRYTKQIEQGGRTMTLTDWLHKNLKFPRLLLYVSRHSINAHRQWVQDCEFPLQFSEGLYRTWSNSYKHLGSSWSTDYFILGNEPMVLYSRKWAHGTLFSEIGPWYLFSEMSPWYFILRNEPMVLYSRKWAHGTLFLEMSPWYFILRNGTVVLYSRKWAHGILFLEMSQWYFILGNGPMELYSQKWVHGTLFSEMSPWYFILRNEPMVLCSQKWVHGTLFSEMSP